MKIDILTLLNPMQHDVSKDNQHNDFETLLNPGQFDDNYYWQHQNQLEQSALTFEPHSSMNKTQTIHFQDKPTLSQLYSESHAESPKQSILPEHERILTRLEMTQEQVLEFKPITAGISHPIEKTITPPERQNSPIKDHGSKIKYIKNSLVQTDRLTPVQFKNHQLFIEDKQAELTLNTTTLSFDEAHALKTLLKKWLQAKSYTLKQLIINGVKQ